MTGIIFRGIEQDNFSILRFYIARANRIVPALAVLCLVLLIFGWFYLIPLEYKTLGEHAGSSLGFFSNIVYWTEVGYFDAAAHKKWLLHTWSLSVEWQFYIIYPLVLVAMRKFMSLSAMKLTILLGTILGFAFCVVATYQWPDLAYYMLPTRMWELTLGGVAYLYPFNMPDNRKKPLEWFGLLLIVGSYFFIPKGTLWPGYIAIFLVFGTFLLIQSQRNDSFITGNIIFQKLGAWSYSIYLWHWPFVVMNSKYHLGYNVYIYFLISILCGFLSFYFIETKKVSIKKTIILFASSLFIAVCVIVTSGAAKRVSKQFRLDGGTSFHKYFGGARYGTNKFIYINGNKSNYDIVFAGDSYARQYAKTIDNSHLRVAALFHNLCLILPTYYSVWKTIREQPSCSDEYAKLKLELSQHDKPLLLAQSWQNYLGNFIQKGGSARLKLTREQYNNLIISELNLIISDNGSNREYYILGSPQTVSVHPFECLGRVELMGFRIFEKCDQFQKRIEIDINEMLDDFAHEHNNVHFIDPNDFLCKEMKCMIMTNGQPIHFDRFHLSVYGTSIVWNEILNAINK